MTVRLFACPTPVPTANVAAAAAGGVIAYLAFATAFGGEAFRLVAAVGIIALGMALTVGGLAERLSRKSSARP